MPTGLRIPIGATPSGGLALTDGEENDRKIIIAALGSDENENAFQQGIGLGADMIFDFSDVTVRARIIRKVVEIFRRFEAQKRYRLRQDAVNWAEDAENQETILSFKYVNLEQDDERLFRQAYDRAGRSRVV
jgi:inorganic pyrophosphatase